MTEPRHQETDEQIRQEAERLLASGLRQILEDYGEVHIIGSYALHLMVWPDLDIHIVQANLDRKGFFELGHRIATLLKPHRMHYRDETLAQTPGLPNGLYWGVYLGNERGGAWLMVRRGTAACLERWEQRIEAKSQPPSQLSIPNPEA